jgi:hypothetical protein
MLDVAGVDSNDAGVDTWIGSFRGYHFTVNLSAGTDILDLRHTPG